MAQPPVILPSVLTTMGMSPRDLTHRWDSSCFRSARDIYRKLGGKWGPCEQWTTRPICIGENILVMPGSLYGFDLDDDAYVAMCRLAASVATERDREVLTGWAVRVAIREGQASLVEEVASWMARANVSAAVKALKA